MNRNTTILLTCITLVLAAVLGWQWFSPAGQRSAHWVAPAAIKPQWGGRTASTSAPESAPNDRSSVLTERPLFSVTRRPVTASVSLAAAPAPTDPLDSVHLYGLFMGPEGGGVIVRAEGKSRRLKVSELLGEWRLQRVSAKEAVFARRGETRTLSLTQVKQGPLGNKVILGMEPTARQVVPPLPQVTAPLSLRPPPVSAPAVSAPPASPASGKTSPGFVIGGAR